MTTYRCRTCGITWQMGPTRDMDPNEQCHCCAREGNAILNARVTELERDAKFTDILHESADADKNRVIDALQDDLKELYALRGEDPEVSRICNRALSYQS